LSKSKKGEEGSVGLLKLVQGVKLRKTVISKRLEAGRVIVLDFKTKAQLLTTTLRNEAGKEVTVHQIIGEGRTLRIVVSAGLFEPAVSISVLTVEKPYKLDPDIDQET